MSTAAGVEAGVEAGRGVEAGAVLILAVSTGVNEDAIEKIEVEEEEEEEDEEAGENIDDEEEEEGALAAASLVPAKPDPDDLLDGSECPGSAAITTEFALVFAIAFVVSEPLVK